MCCARIARKCTNCTVGLLRGEPSETEVQVRGQSQTTKAIGRGKGQVWTGLLALTGLVLRFRAIHSHLRAPPPTKSCSAEGAANWDPSWRFPQRKVSYGTSRPCRSSEFWAPRREEEAGPEGPE